MSGGRPKLDLERDPTQNPKRDPTQNPKRDPTQNPKRDPKLDPKQSPKVIYVMGAGRSGSTILGVTLGNCEQVFYAGELDAWLRRSGVPTKADGERAQFWTTVREETGGEDLFGDSAWRALEHSQTLFRFYRWPVRRRLRKRYLEVSEGLYRAIARTAGATHIVDTSHYPLRVRELRRLAGIDIYLIYLVRNPQSVVASFNRRDTPKSRKSPLATNAYLWLTHLLSMAVFLSHRSDRKFILYHEDFAANPDQVLDRILGALDIQSAAPDLKSLERGIPFQGNRLLKSKVIAFRGGDGSPAQRSRLTSLLHSPWVAALSHLRPRVVGSLSDEHA